MDSSAALGDRAALDEGATQDTREAAVLSRPLLTAAGISIAAGVGIQAALVASGPLLARMLGVEGRGQLAALLLWPVVIAQLGSLGVPIAITYYLADRGCSTAGVVRKGLAFAIPQLLALTAVHAAVLSVLLRDASQSQRLAGAVTLVLVPALLAQQYGLAVLQGRQRFLAFNGLRLLPAVSYASGIVVLFLAREHALLPIVIVWVSGNAAGGAAALFVALRQVGNDRDTDGDVSRQQLVSFGLRALLGTASPIENFRLDQMVLALFLTPVALGVYVVALAFTNLPRFLAQSVGMVAYPAVAAQTDAAGRRSMWTFFWGAIALNVLIIVPLMFAAGWLVPLFFGSEFTDAVSISRILLIGAGFASARRVLADGLKGRGNPGASTVAEVLALVWLLPALAVLAPFLGVTGVAIALTSSYAGSFVALLVIAIMSGEAQAFAVTRAFAKALYTLRLWAGVSSP